MALQSLVSSTRPLVDAFLVARMGDNEIAAFGYSGRVMYVILLAIMGMADGGAVIVAQYRGSGDEPKTRESTAVTVAIVAALASAATVACFVLADVIAGLGTENAAIATLSAEYIRVSSLMILPFGAISALAASVRCFGDARLAMRFSLVGLAAHLALSFALVPRLGVSGAAWATTASTFLECAAFAAFVYLTRHPAAFRAGDLRRGFAHGLARMIRVVGGPVALSSAAWAGGLLVYTILVGRSGEQHLAALSMINPIESVAIAVINGLATATSVVIGNTLGAAASEATTWRLAKALLLWNGAVAAVAGALLACTSLWLGEIYGNADPLTVEAAGQALAVLGGLFVFRAMSMVLQNGLLRAGGDTLYVLGADLSCQWLVGIPLTFLTALHWGSSFPVILAAVYSEEIAKTVLSGYRVWRGRWTRSLVA
ncbi:MATE family efflux transporter [Streptomyces sp. NPDC020472]|uniref:MATE family efflux transporter n=1 Tax=Streptomyces sp. NPDC020472 TaxID=3365075 RepID=UPI00378930AF